MTNQAYEPSFVADMAHDKISVLSLSTARIYTFYLDGSNNLVSDDDFAREDNRFYPAVANSLQGAYLLFNQTVK